MGKVGEKRLNYSAPFTNLQSDLIGPFAVKEYYNSRGTRKLWILVSICDFTRYITLIPVESLNKTDILNSFQSHFHRFGRSQKIETDLGTNFVAAKADLGDAEIDEDDLAYITETLRSSGVTLIQRAAKAPWIQGSIERANAMVKKIFPQKRLHNLVEI